MTRYTSSYLKSLSVVLGSRGLHPKWSNNIHGSRWGVNTNDFSFKLRTSIQKVVFVAGNGGYKDRKAGAILLPRLINLASQRKMQVDIFSQRSILDINNLPEGFAVHEKTFPDRSSAYDDGDLFLFPSYWEGLCHGIYEASYSGGIVITTDHPPMNECVPALKIPVTHCLQEKLDKPINKAIPCMDSLERLVLSLYGEKCESLSLLAHKWVANERYLPDTLDELYAAFAGEL